jgi:hypothetical protein
VAVPAVRSAAKYLYKWSKDERTLDNINERTIAAILAAFQERWNGNGRLTTAGLKAPQYLFAMVVDPATSANYRALPIDWHDKCKKVLKKFDPDTEQRSKADQELCTLVKHEGMFGDRVSDVQDACRVPALVMRAMNMTRNFYMLSWRKHSN